MSNKRNAAFSKVYESKRLDENLRDIWKHLMFFSLLVPVRSPSNDPIENVESTVTRDRIKNFGGDQLDDESDIRSMIGTSRPYTQSQFNQPEYSRTEVNNSCEYLPSSNMTRSDHLFHGIPLYVDQKVTITNEMIFQANQLSWVLMGLAKNVFVMPVETMHLFRDIDSGKKILDNKLE
jgi:hypothetical protein